jgi:hypothetical protein
MRRCEGLRQGERYAGSLLISPTRICRYVCVCVCRKWYCMLFEFSLDEIDDIVSMSSIYSISAIFRDNRRRLEWGTGNGLLGEPVGANPRCAQPDLLETIPTQFCFRSLRLHLHLSHRHSHSPILPSPTHPIESSRHSYSLQVYTLNCYGESILPAPVAAASHHYAPRKAGLPTSSRPVSTRSNTRRPYPGPSLVDAATLTAHDAATAASSRWSRREQPHPRCRSHLLRPMAR